jgi:Ca2+-binding EF-hand superfamily protein
VANDTPIIFLNDRQRSSTQLVQQLLERYDRVSDDGEKDHRLSREEIKLGDATFAKLDADANAHLDFDELRQWLRDRGTSVEVLVPLRQHESQPSPVQMITPADQLPSGMEVRSGADGSLALVLGQVQFQFIGRDGDGKVFLSELKTFFNRVFALRNNRTVVSIRDLGKQLFEVLDTSADGRLSSRELIAGQEKIPLWDQQGDRQVSLTEVPRHWSWSVLRGQAIEAGTQASAQTVRMQRTEGPRWFTRMDRNNDGDLTPREFLGSAADFEQFDRNRDGAIDVAEAAARD